jgi:hypothetical protein
MNFPWLLRWILPLLVVSLFLIVCYHAIPFLELENFWYHYSGACAVAIGFYWYWVTYIKGPNLGIQFIDNLFGRSQVTKVNTSQYINGTSMVLYNSKGKHLWGMIAWLGIGLFILYYAGYKQKSYFWGFFIGCFSLSGAFKFGRDLFNSSPQLILREDGLATPKLGFIKWENVKTIQLRDSSSGESSSTNLDIYVYNEKSPDDTLRADLLSVGEENLRISISRFAKREVPFV